MSKKQLVWSNLEEKEMQDLIIGGIYYLDIKMCNCFKCEMKLIGLSMSLWYLSLNPREKQKLPKLCAKRVNDRPMCDFCYSKHVEEMTNKGVV